MHDIMYFYLSLAGKIVDHVYCGLNKLDGKQEYKWSDGSEVRSHEPTAHVCALCQCLGLGWGV